MSAMSEASLVRVELIVPRASVSELTALVCMLPALSVISPSRVFTALESTSLTVETKVLLTWLSTVLAPVSVIFGAMALAFSLT